VLKIILFWIPFKVIYHRTRIRIRLVIASTNYKRNPSFRKRERENELYKRNTCDSWFDGSIPRCIMSKTLFVSDLCAPSRSVSKGVVMSPASVILKTLHSKLSKSFQIQKKQTFSVLFVFLFVCLLFIREIVMLMRKIAGINRNQQKRTEDRLSTRDARWDQLFSTIYSVLFSIKF
jgi:hypothetical protein